MKNKIQTSSTQKYWRLPHFLFSLLVCSLAACGGGGGGSTPPPPPPLSSDATLSALTVSAGAIAPVFASGTTNYTLTGTATSTTVTPTVNHPNATVMVGRFSVGSGSASPSIALPAGISEIRIVVTAEDGATTQTYTVALNRFISLELFDPFPGASNEFGSKVVQLANGNIVVGDPGDSSRFANNGAVHLFSPFSSTPIASIFGNAGGDQLGSSSITALGNNNFVIASSDDDEGGIVDAGSVRLVNGSTGEQIGTTLAGDVGGDRLGYSGITALNNNNYVIASAFDDEGGITNAGSVRLINGSTGEQIGATLAGDVAGDQLGSSSITALDNNNYVIASGNDSEDGIGNAGSVRLINGSTGEQIGATLAGDVENDHLGSSSITTLGNNNYVIASREDDNEGGINRAGSIRLVNGSTGEQIGDTLAGHVINENLGINGITALANNNYVVVSAFGSEGGIVNSGSVRLMDGSTGMQVGATLAGDVEGDQLGLRGSTALGNNNYVIASSGDDEGGISNAGSVRLVNGSTGEQIGATLAGDAEHDQLGSSSITALGNNNYVIASSRDDEGGILDAGSVRLVNGSTGEQIGATLAGDTLIDRFGHSSVTALGNNNYVIASSRDDEGGIVDAGSVRLVDGSTGEPIGTTLAGDMTNDELGSNGITALGNNNYLITSRFDDEDGIVDAGSVRLANGSTGAELGTAIIGEFSDDMAGVQVLKPISGDYYILIQPRADTIGQEDAGRVRIVVP